MTSRKTWQFVFRIIVAGLTLFILGLHVGRIEDIVRAMLNIRLSFVMTAVSLMLVNIYIQYRKWMYMLRLYYPEVSGLETLGSILIGFTLGMITPGRLGELGRGFFLRHLNKWHITGLTLLDKMFNNLVIFFAGCLALYYLFKYPFSLSIYVLAPFAILVVIVWVIIYRIIAQPQKVYQLLLQWSSRFSRLEKMKPFIQSLENIYPYQVRVLLGYSMLFYGIIFIQFLLLLGAFADYAIIPSLAGIIATMFSKTLLPISIADLGIREGAAVYFLYQVNVAKIHAFNASLLLFAINILLPSGIGALLIPRLSLYNNNKSEDVRTTDSAGETN